MPSCIQVNQCILAGPNPFTTRAQAEMLRAAAATAAAADDDADGDDANDDDRQVAGEALEGEDALEQHWRSVEQTEQQAAGGAVGGAVGGGARGAVFAPNARSVDTPAYLRALWSLCEAQAAAWLGLRLGLVPLAYPGQ